MIPKKVIDNRKNNTKRGVSNETKQEVLIRDDYACVICRTRFFIETTPHHAYYWGEAIHTPNRNDSDQLVTICKDCHHALHFGYWNEYRIYCIDYLKRLWNMR